MLFDYDNDTALQTLFTEYGNINILNSSLSEKRSKYRKFSDIIQLDFNALDSCIKNSENVLLISCYTFSEQLIKNVIYHLIEKDNNNNKHVNKFIDSKIHPSKFSPNVLSNEIVKALNLVGCDFELILAINHEAFHKYDAMIKARHLYAHANKYMFTLEQFEYVLKVLEYLNFEISSLVRDNILRKKMVEDYKNLKIIAEKIKKCQNKSARNPDIKKIKNMCKNFYKKYQSSLGTLQLFEEIFATILTISKIDLRKKQSIILYYEEITHLATIL